MLFVKNMQACYVLNEYINKDYRLFPQKRYQNTVLSRLASNQALYICDLGFKLDAWNFLVVFGVLVCFIIF